MARAIATQREFAAKRYSLDPAARDAASVKEEIAAELRTLQDHSSGHPNIVQYEKVIETQRNIFVLMELVGREPGCRGVDLFGFIANERPDPMDEGEAR